MHSAPAVNYPVGRSRFQGWLTLSLGLGASATGLHWLRQGDFVGWRLWLFALILMGACGAAAAVWLGSARGSLRWDGQMWHWVSAAVSLPVHLTVHLDGQFVLLLSLRADTGKRFWLWPERRFEPMHWNALRRAVFSHGGRAHVQSVSVDVDAAQR